LPPRRNTSSRTALLLLLPLLTLRLLMPPGYMLAGAGELGLVMCSDGLTLPDSARSSDGGDGGQRIAADFDCPFVQAQGSAPPPHFDTSAVAATRKSQALRAPALALPPPTGPPRTGGARAPPRSPKNA
jgi:hypothetical protein